MAAVVQAAAVFVVLAVVELVVRYGGDVDLPFPLVVVPFGIGLLAGAAGCWWASRVHRSWRYELSPDRLVVEHGVITTRSAVLPRSRVQHVSSERGPLQRWLGLVTLTVHTAGANTPNVSIPNLLVDTAEELRRQLIVARR